MNIDEYKVCPKRHLSIIHTWPWKWTVWLCGLHSEATDLKLLEREICIECIAVSE